MKKGTCGDTTPGACMRFPPFSTLQYPGLTRMPDQAISPLEEASSSQISLAQNDRLRTPSRSSRLIWGAWSNGSSSRKHGKTRVMVSRGGGGVASWILDVNAAIATARNAPDHYRCPDRNSVPDVRTTSVTAKNATNH